MTRNSDCPICSSADRFVFLERLDTPVHQHRLHGTRESATRAPRADLRLAACHNCGFVSNLDFETGRVHYAEGYDNDQSASARFDAHISDVASALVSLGLRGRRILEIGCGNGRFLERLCEKGDNRGLGVDPAYDGPPTRLGGRARFVRAAFPQSEIAIESDALVCRHVVEHLPQPMELLRALRSVAPPGEALPLYLETPDLHWILEGVVVHDFFYEHCSYFTAANLAWAAWSAGFAMARATPTFGGQYLSLFTASDASGGRREPVALDVGPLLAAIERYRDRERSMLERIAARLGTLRRDGPVAIWGAGAKGVTFLNLLDPRADVVDCVVDQNPRKQGGFVAGTGHPIVAPADLAERGARHVIVMNPNYLDEIRAAVRRIDATVAVHGDRGE